MAFSINGIGTTYFGKGDYEADGSYVTTKWFVLGFVPLIPLGSVRVQHLGARGGPFRSSEHYAIVGEEPLWLAQVLRTWLYVIAMFAALGWMCLVPPDDLMQVGLRVGVFFAGLALPHVLRWRQRRRVMRAAPKRKWAAGGRLG